MNMKLYMIVEIFTAQLVNGTRPLSTQCSYRVATALEDIKLGVHRKARREGSALDQLYNSGDVIVYTYQAWGYSYYIPK